METEDDMPAARPEFVYVSEAEAWAALKTDDGGPIAAEVTRLVIELARRSKTRARNGAQGGLQARARCPIERVAVAMMSVCRASVAPVH